MKTIKVATLAGLVALVQAQNGDFIITNSDFDLVAGEEFTLEWTGNEGPVTIRLQTGPEDNLETVEVLAGAFYALFCFLALLFPQSMSGQTIPLLSSC